jgi:hypothetical protein
MQITFPLQGEQMTIPCLNDNQTIPISWMSLGDSITIIRKFVFQRKLTIIFFLGK